MKYSNKGPSPKSFQDWLAQANANWIPSYEILRKPEIVHVRSALLNEQDHLCAYCGRLLKDDFSDSHIDHFRPQNRYNGQTPPLPDLTLDYTNFVASCGPRKESQQPSICGDAKGSQFDENLDIEPWDVNCEGNFMYGSTGEISAVPNNNAEAIYMINLLNLNHKALVDDRAKIVADIEEFISTPSITRAMVDNEIQRLRTPTNGKRTAFSQVAIRYLEIECVNIK